MNKSDKVVIIKYRRMLLGTLIFMYMGYILLNYFYNEYLISNGHEMMVVGSSFPILAGSVILVVLIIFKVIEELNNS